jgi:hypothetical protein
MTDKKEAPAARQKALQTLVFLQKPELAPLLQEQLADPVVRGPALRGLAAFADEKTPGLILGAFSTFTEEEKSDAVHTLASRPAYALALLDAVERGQVPRTDVLGLHGPADARPEEQASHRTAGKGVGDNPPRVEG